MQGSRIRWLLALAVIAGLSVTGAAWGAGAGGGSNTASADESARAAATAAGRGNNTDSQQMHMFLTANGNKLIGDSSTPAGADGSIEALAFTNAVITPREAGSGLPTGRRQYQPLLIRKRIDKNSPLLMRALTNGERIDGQIQFFRPAAGGGRNMEHYYTITITGGRLVNYKLDSATGDAAPTEELQLTFERIRWTYVDGGITHEDTWDSQR